MNELMNHQRKQKPTSLQVIQRFCSEKICFQGLEPDVQVSQYHQNTNQLLEEELQKAIPDPESIDTIAANFMLIMANTAEAQKQREKRITFVTEAYDPENAKRMVDSTIKISDRHEHTVKVVNTLLKLKKVVICTFSIVTLIVVLLLVVSIAFGAISYSEKKKRDDYEQSYKPEEKNIFQQARDWVWHDVIGSPREKTEFEQQTEKLTIKMNSHQRIAGILLIVYVVIIFIIVIGICLLSTLVHRSLHVIDEWNSYQALCELFDKASMKAKGDV